nr:MAG TPA: Minor structural protein putative tail fiber [Caudoviricetes sp.]
MIGVSDRYKANMVAPVKSVKVKLVEVVPDGQTPLELKSGDSLVSAKITAVGEFLGTGAKQLNAVLIGEFNQLQSKTFKVFIGIEDPTTNETDWACQGDFRVETANLSIEKGTTELVAYDAMTRAYKTEYANSLLSFPCTIKNLIEQVAGTFGLELDQAEIAKLPNINYTVKQDPYKKIKGATYRQILDELAQATGSTVIISCGKLLFKQYAEPVNSIDTNNMLTFKVGEKWGVPTKLALAREPQEDNTMLEDRELEKLPTTKNILNLTDLTKVFSSPASILKRIGENEIELTSDGTHGAWTSYNFRAKNITAGKYIFGAKGEAENFMDGRPSVILCNINRRGARGEREAYYEMSWGGDTAGKWRTVVFTVTQEMLDAGKWFDMGFYAIGRNANIKQNCKYSDIILAKFDEGGNNTYVPYISNGSKDIKLVNNELLDDDRQALIQPLFDTLIKPANIKMDELEIKTEGHGIYEVGDNITCKVNGETYNLNVSETRLELAGGIKETLICRPPKFNATDRTTAGGIKQTIYNTELKTDRQQQEITAVVSKQEKSEQYNLEQFTQVKQDIHNITQTVQVVGGGNLIKNSVGYGIDGQKNLVNWDYNHDTAKITSETSPASITAGALSGNQINLTASTMSQRIYVKSAEPHTLTARVLKGIVGSGKIELVSDLDHYVINLEDQKSYHWDEVALTFTPKMGWLDVKITADANSTFSITDLMLAGGDTKQPWRQSAGEIYNTQVSLDANGIQVRSSVYSGDYVEITPLEFSGYSTAGGQKRKVFTLNRDTTEVEKIKVRTQIDMPPIKIVPFQGGQNQGWAFVPNI